MNRKAKHYYIESIITALWDAEGMDEQDAYETACKFVNYLDDVDSAGIQVARDKDTWELYLIQNNTPEDIVMDITHNLIQHIAFDTDYAFGMEVIANIPQFIEIG